ncbi:hypothetical protein VP01_5603g1, partial [Puccinia sorghi]
SSCSQTQESIPSWIRNNQPVHYTSHQSNLQHAIIIGTMANTRRTSRTISGHARRRLSFVLCPFLLLFLWFSLCNLKISASLRLTVESTTCMLKEESKIHPATTLAYQKPLTTTEVSRGMDKVNSTVLKTSIEGIPLLMNNNYTIWRIRALNLFDLIGLKEQLVKDKIAVLPSEENKLLKSILVAKLDSLVQTNFINTENKNSAILIRKSINQFFASNQSSNKARLFQSFLCTPDFKLDSPRLDGSVDRLGHLVLDNFPPNMNTIADMITHYGKDMTIDSFLDHLCLHANNQHVYTRCKRGAHNTAANHTEENCWFLHPGMRKAHMEKMATLKNKATVSSFHLSITRNPSQFILDSGSSSHMMNCSNQLNQ